jgi:polysaccharide pyruvyl transferase WcaK-like protein
MSEMAVAEVVVASRFHNLICALKLGKPTVSLGYAGKNARLLSDFGLGEFSQVIDSFDVDLLVDQIAEVKRRRATLERHFNETLRRYDEQLSEQFRRLSVELLAWRAEALAAQIGSSPRGLLPRARHRRPRRSASARPG